MVQYPRRVFILSHSPLFSQGVKHLLANQPAIEVVGCEKALDAAQYEIERLKPEFILVDRTEVSIDDASLLQLLRAEPQASIMGLDLESAVLYVYRRECHTVREVQDLVQVIEKSTKPAI